MRRTDLSLDEEIAEVEGRLAQHRMQLRALVAEARSRVSLRNAVPVALVAALAVGFTASRFVRRPAPPPLQREAPARHHRGRRASPERWRRCCCLDSFDRFSTLWRVDYGEIC